MDEYSTEPKKDGELRDPNSVPAQTRRVWETPALEELSVQLSAAQPRVGGDGGTYADCTRS
jgi:hypothetical protein